MSMRIPSGTDLRFADRLRAAGHDVPTIPTLKTASRPRDRVALSAVAKPRTAAPSFWDRLGETFSFNRLTNTVSSWLPNWLRPAPAATAGRMTTKRVGQGIHIIGSLPGSQRKDGGGLNPQAKAAFAAMTAAAASQGITLRVSSSYRSFEHQKRLFDRSDKSGHWVAAPGHSEHQTGLAFDVGTKGYSGGKSGNFGRSPAYRWLQENGYRYGFVQSMSWEPWHWHYDPLAVAKATGDTNRFLA
jgi:LAS superfamily LD-carboxypeptidase LdcB